MYSQQAAWSISPTPRYKNVQSDTCGPFPTVVGSDDVPDPNFLGASTIPSTSRALYDSVALEDSSSDAGSQGNSFEASLMRMWGLKTRSEKRLPVMALDFGSTRSD
jgi:hypothetical protein